MRESMAQLTPKFSADRTVREYTEKHYIPAAITYLERTSDKGEKAKILNDRLHSLNQNWESMSFGEAKFEKIGQQYKFDVQLFVNNIDPDAVQVELFAQGINQLAPTVQKMKKGKKITGSGNGYNFSVLATADRLASDYTVRAIPNLPVSVPLEISKILWQR